MKINQAGLDLVKTYEGFRSDIYICSGNRKTYGYGSTRGFDGKRLTGNENPISREDAEKLLKRDLQSAEKAIHRMVKVPLSENQFNYCNKKAKELNLENQVNFHFLFFS